MSKRFTIGKNYGETEKITERNLVPTEEITQPKDDIDIYLETDFMYHFCAMKRAISEEESKLISKLLLAANEKGHSVLGQEEMTDTLLSTMMKRAFLYINSKTNERILFGWFESIQYHNDTVTVDFSKHIVKYLKTLKEWLNHYKCDRVFSFASGYSVLLYEYLYNQQFFDAEVSSLEINMETMREILYCTKKYYAVNQFKNRVDAAIKEIGNHVQCEYLHGTYNRVTGFRLCCS